MGAASLGAASLLFASQGSAMERFGMYGKMIAKPGQRDALVEILLEASRQVSSLPGCEIYIVGKMPTMSKLTSPSMSNTEH